MTAFRFCREAGTLVPVNNPKPAPGETMTAFMSRMVREKREAEALQPLLDVDGNPWSREKWNITSQMRLMNRHPDLAAELRRQAGVGD